MDLHLNLLLVAVTALMVTVQAQQQQLQPNIYAYQAYDIDGNLVSMEKYRGKVVYITNAASYCTLTPLNYIGMRNLYNKYKKYGFEIAAFPSNQFKQEPDPVSVIKVFAQQKYGAEYDLYNKIEVNGPNAHPLWKYLKAKVPGVSLDTITWNFAKFLVDRNGVPVSRYQPVISPDQIEYDIVRLLNQQATPTPQPVMQSLQQTSQQQSRQLYYDPRNGQYFYYQMSSPNLRQSRNGKFQFINA